MRKFIIFLITLLCVGCCPCRHLQPSYQEKVRYETIIKEKVDTVYVELPKEYVEVFRQDSSFIETSVAWSKAKVDSTGLHHIISNKTDVPIKTVTKEVEVVRDSIVIKEIPVEVIREKVKYPRSFWYLLGLVILFVGWRIFKLFRYTI